MNADEVILEVRIRRDEHGRIGSYHDFRTDQDRQKSEEWEGGGARQIAHALLTEAARREAFATSLVRLSQDMDFLTQYDRGTKEQKEEIENQLATAVRIVIHRTLGKMGRQIAREILQMLVVSVRSDDE